MDNLETNMPSVLHIFSIGVAAVNLPLSSKILEVTPLEKTSMLNGELTDNATQNVVGIKDSVGASDEAKTTTTATLQATWIPFGSNRFTPPNIRRGEKVLIWKKGNADEYFWSEYEYNADLRKLETIVFLLSNTQDENAKADSTNSLYFEFSTHSKMVHMRYNNSDGEPHAWDFQLNAKDSVFIVTDDINNKISIDSKEKNIQIVNADDTTLILDKKNARLFAPENMEFESGLAMAFKVGTQMTHQVGDTWSWVAGGAVTGTMPSASYTSKDTSFSGNVTVGKMLSTGGFFSANTEVGGFKVNGQGTFNGGFTVNGSVTVTDNISAGGTVTGSNIN